MSLVGNYGSSDSESSDVESSTAPTLPKKSTGSGLGSLLPPPKNKSSKSVVYVDLPKATQDSDDEEDEAEKRAKRQKVTSSSGRGKGLAALLPPPKRSYTFAKKANSGNSSAAPTPSVSSDLKPSAEEEAEEESVHEDQEPDTEELHTEEAFTGSFFRLGKFTDQPIATCMF